MIIIYICPICGFSEILDLTYCSICPCCYTEFGYDDCTKTHEELREKWIEDGCIFHNERLDWTKEKAIEQLKGIGITVVSKNEFIQTQVNYVIERFSKLRNPPYELPANSKIQEIIEKIIDEYDNSLIITDT